MFGSERIEDSSTKYGNMIGLLNSKDDQDVEEFLLMM